MSNFDEIAKGYASIINSTLAIDGDNMLEYFTMYKTYYIQDIVKQLQRKKTIIKILDYGCGVGTLSQALYNNIPGISLHGYDISEESIANVPKGLKIGDNKFTSNLEVLDYDYDLSILCNVMHHVDLGDRSAVLESIKHRLSKRGLLLMIEHNMLNPLTRKSVIDCPFDQDAHMLTMGEASKLLINAGFGRQLRRYITFFPPRFSALRVLDKYIGWIPLGAQYMVCAKQSD